MPTGTSQRAVRAGQGWFGPTSFQRTHCVSGAAIGAPIQAASGEPFAYDPATDSYKFAWKTQKAWATWCGTLTVALDDGTSETLAVRFTI